MSYFWVFEEETETSRGGGKRGTINDLVWNPMAENIRAFSYEWLAINDGTEQPVQQINAGR